MKLEGIKKLLSAERYQEALVQIEKLLEQNDESPYLWILRGDLIQLLDTKDGPPLAEAAKSYSNALKFNPNDLEALEGLAHFYDTVDCKPDRATQYATKYIQKVKERLGAMEKIIAGE